MSAPNILEYLDKCENLQRRTDTLLEYIQNISEKEFDNILEILDILIKTLEKTHPQ